MYPLTHPCTPYFGLVGSLACIHTPRLCTACASFHPSSSPSAHPIFSPVLPCVHLLLAPHPHACVHLCTPSLQTTCASMNPILRCTCVLAPHPGTHLHPRARVLASMHPIFIPAHASLHPILAPCMHPCSHPAAVAPCTPFSPTFSPSTISQPCPPTRLSPAPGLQACLLPCSSYRVT